MAVKNNAGMNIHVEVVMWLYVSIAPGYYLRVGLLDYIVTRIFNILRNYKTVSISS